MRATSDGMPSGPAGLFPAVYVALQGIRSSSIGTWPVCIGSGCISFGCVRD